MIATLLLAIVVFALVLGLLFWARRPSYRIQRSNVIALLELVLSGQASENDWRVFSCVPLSHDPELARVRQQCLEIEEREYLGARPPGFLFREQGLEELQEILKQLRTASPQVVKQA